jgi:predicted double-glycine peptidase
VAFLVGALVIAAVFAVLVGFTSSIYPLQDQPKSELNITVPGPGSGSLRTNVNPASEMNKGHLIKQGYDFSCGSAALSIILNFYLGEKFTERQVIAGLMHYGDPAQIAKRQAFSLLDMKKFVKALGYQSEGYRADIEDLKTLTTPCIIPIKIMEYRHFVVFRGIYKGHIFLADPWRGDISFTLEQFPDIWYDKVLFVVTTDGGPTISALKLKTDDLRFIDEDAARETMFGNSIRPEVAAAEKEFKQLVDIPGEYQYYKGRK